MRCGLVDAAGELWFGTSGEDFMEKSVIHGKCNLENIETDFEDAFGYLESL